MLVDSIDELIGNTPLIKMGFLSQEANIYAKAEFFNPGSSIKDRVAKNMIDEALREGIIDKDTTVIEPTSGNTGIGLALICALYGMKLILTMPESMSIERQKLLKHLGAELILTPSSEGMSGAIKRAKSLKQEIKNSWIANQFSNPNNPKAHAKTTAKEILKDLSKVDVFVAGVGTGGTLSGCAKVFKEQNRECYIVAIEPKNSPIISQNRAGAHKIQGIGAGFIPDNLDLSLIDEVLVIDDDEAIEYAKLASKKGGLLVGISAGANLAGSLRLSKRVEFKDKNIVTILPDTAERYISTELFN